MNKVTVAILNWNGMDVLPRFIPSVVSNTPAEYSIAVIDNGSTDGSVEYLRAHFPQVTILRLDDNYGFAEGYNRGIGRIDSEYTVLLNSDVETPHGWIGPLIDRLDSDPGVAAVSPKIRSLRERDKFEYAGACGGFIDRLGYPFCRGRILSYTEKDNGQYDSARPVFWATGACMAVRTGVFKALGGFDRRFFAHMEEIDLCWRAQRSGYTVMVEPQAVVYHLGGATLNEGSPHKTYLNFRNNLAMIYKNGGKGRGPVLFARQLLDGIAAIVYMLQGKKEHFRAVVKAHGDYRSMRPYLKDKRQEIVTANGAEIKGMYRGSIILRYILGKKTFGRLM